MVTEVTSSAAASSATSTAKRSAEKQKNDFLQLLLTQLQNQNPTDPMDSKEFASQLAQYSQLEQQIDTNSKLDDLIAATNTSKVSPLSYLGTTVDYNSDTAPVQDGEASWSYSTVGATEVSIVVKDQTGAIVYSGAGDTAAGANRFTLTAGSSDANGAPLTISVSARNADGVSIPATITARAKITAVDTSSGAAMLEASGYRISTDLIQRVASVTSPTTPSTI